MSGSHRNGFASRLCNACKQAFRTKIGNMQGSIVASVFKYHDKGRVWYSSKLHRSFKVRIGVYDASCPSRGLLPGATSVPSVPVNAAPTRKGCTLLHLHRSYWIAKRLLPHPVVQPVLHFVVGLSIGNWTKVGCLAQTFLAPSIPCLPMSVASPNLLCPQPEL